MRSPKASTEVERSVEVPNSGGARRTVLSPDQLTGLVLDDARTLPQGMERGRRLSNNGPCLGWRGEKPQYEWITYSEVIERARQLASGLVLIGMKPGQSTFVGIYSRNCVEWILTEYACYNQSAVTVPLYDTLGAAACKYIINQTEMELVVCDTDEKAKALVSSAAETPTLKIILVISDPSEDLKAKAKEKGVDVHLFKDVQSRGKLNPCPLQLPNPDDLSTICYTSGTTGDPKGVVITHANMISTACGVNLHLGQYAPTTSDVFLSFLPLAHMMERTDLLAYFISGASIGFWRGNVNLLMEDMQLLRPTMMAVVPRLLNRIQDKVMAKAHTSKIKTMLLNIALKRKMASMKRSGIRNDTIWDKLVFKPIREGMGGRLRLVICGAAPLSETVLNFARCALGCVVCEGYGQTETCAPCAIGYPGDLTPCQVGPPLPCCQIKLADVPEMEYFAAKGQGEVCIKGSSVFQGYYKLPDKTLEALDEDGYLHTGDIGMWLPNGALRLVDRKKNIFKLSQGEYITPEKIENVYVINKYVDQIFVHGESLKSSLVGIVVPDRDTIQAWCEEHNIKGKWEELCKNEAVKSMILGDLVALGKTAGLKSFEQVKDIFLHPLPLTYEDGLLTPTSKLKRHACKAYFWDRIQDMYRNLP